MKKFAIVTALALSALTLNSRAQDPAGSPPPGGGPGKGGQHERPNPQQLAAKLMDQFDTNKDNELEHDELTAALEFLRSHRPPHPGGGGGQGGAPAGGPGAADGQKPEPPPADKVAAHMIETFASDKKGLTVDELAKALAERFEHHGPKGGGPGGKPPGSPAESGTNQ